MSATLQLVAVELIDDHPDNPRLVFRDDVVDGIVANLNGEWPQQHALHVRPLDGRFQILSGHHRKRAADRAGIGEVWCWVEAMEDDAAFMVLATANNQGELSPLEIGCHALQAVPLGKRGRGNKGDGLSDYARALGKSQSVISQYRQAAKVLNVSAKCIDQSILLEKAAHLAAIHALPEPCWQVCVESLGTMSKDEVRQRVSEANDFLSDFDPGDEWQGYLVPTSCACAVFSGTDPNNFRRLLTLADSVVSSLEKHEDLQQSWRSWLLQNTGGESYDIAKCQAKRIELEGIAWDRENSEQAEDVYDVLLADPPWRYDHSSTDSRQIENQYPTAEVDEICDHCNEKWFPALAEDCVLFMWATAPKLREALQVIEAWGFEYRTHAIWDKQRVGMGYWFRGQHELLLVAVRGTPSPPEPSNRVASVFVEQRDQRHSKKPECVYEAIETMLPASTKFELYQREPRAGWQGFGNETA